MTDQNKHKMYMQRAIDLARLGAGYASPNPMVGAVIVHNDEIIGEGYHQHLLYGNHHAEVNAVASVSPTNLHRLQEATMYVSLEPCCIYGKTPPCSDLIIKHKIPNVVISTIDQTPNVQGSSLEILKNNHINVESNILKDKGAAISAIRNTFVSQKRPYIIIKYAESVDGYMGKEDQQIWLSNAISKRLVHKWRSEADAIIVGTNTALVDNPQLNNRYYYGKSPLRIVLDRQLRMPSHLHLLNDEQTTWIITEKETNQTLHQTRYLQIPFDTKLLSNLLQRLYDAEKSTLIVEGGARLINSFISENFWDEIRVFKTDKRLHEGVTAPLIEQAPSSTYKLLNDQLVIYKNECYTLNGIKK